MAPEHEHPDEHILELLPTNGEQAVELMFRKYYGFLCQAVLKVLPDGQVAEDLAQEVFLDVWKKRNEISISTSLGAYLRRAAVNKTLNYIRDRKIRWDDEDKLPLMASNSASAAQELEGEDLQKIIQRAIDDLPERCRLVFSLSRFEEMSYQQIAGELEISIKTVENQMTKALKMLKMAIGPFLKGE